ncbi:MAG TPA: sensor histidine kinase, partial [Thermoanaerobaculia bacterium]|nr:sensor histidine kinase [Thermoanaerobaculia bacterium]
SALALAIPGRDQRMDAQFARINELVDEAIAAVRRIASELRPPVLDDFGLPAAIHFAADDFQRDTSIACEVSIRPDDFPAEATTAIVLYRILQEALTNVARHSGATSVEVRLRSDERDLLLEVRDNGRGVEEAQIHDPTSLGLTGMRERAALVNGELRIEGVPARGTIVSVRIPVTAEKK